MNEPANEPVVKVSLAEIYTQTLATDRKVDQLALTVEQLVAVNRRLDNHAERLRKVEARLSAVWLVVGVVVTVAGSALIKIFTGG